jgi:hypothetical protein
LLAKLNFFVDYIILNNTDDIHLSLTLRVEQGIDLINFWIKRVQFFRKALDDRGGFRIIGISVSSGLGKADCSTLSSVLRQPIAQGIAAVQSPNQPIGNPPNERGRNLFDSGP